jgi:K+-sensing histidine kinase KdpD
MRVDSAVALRVLAHELRSPAGVAQGYVRMLLEGRLPEPAEQRRALEQIRNVLARIGQLSRQASEAASWLERAEGAAPQRIDARGLVDAAIRAVERTHALDSVFDLPEGAASVTTTDREALAMALASLLEATAREWPGKPTRVRVHTTEAARDLELLAGGGESLAALSAGPDGPHATPLVVERGGMGLTLVTAALVLDTHGAATWTIDGDRGGCGIRIPLETRGLW